MAKTKKLSLADFYVVGKEVTFDDGTNKLTVWVQKINQFQHEKCFRAANAVRAKINLKLSKEGIESEEFLPLLNQYEEYLESREKMLQFLVDDKIADNRGAVEAEVASRDEWKEDGHLQGVEDALRTADVNSEEFAELAEEYRRFYSQVEEELEPAREAILASFDDLTDDALYDKVVRKLIRIYADLSWLAEFRKHQIFHAVRNADNHHELFFDSMEEMHELPTEVLSVLTQTYEAMSVDTLEGKS